MSIFNSKARKERERIAALERQVIIDAVEFVKEHNHPARDTSAVIITRENLIESVGDLREERGW